MMYTTLTQALRCGRILAAFLVIVLLGAGAKHVAAQTCTFVTHANLIKTAPIGLVAQGDSTWTGNQAGPPPNDVSVLFNYDVGTFKQIGIFAYWSQILSSANGTPDFSSIDNALCALKKYNLKTGDNVTAKLRIVPDSRAIDANNNMVNVTASPAYALNVGGQNGGIIIQKDAGTSSPVDMAIGAYWLPAYSADWKALNDALAAHYDTYDIITEVSVNACASVDLEPWLQPRNPDNSEETALTVYTGSNKYTDGAVLACLDTEPDTYASWTHTPLINVFGSYSCLGDTNDTKNCPMGSTKIEYTDTTNTMTNYNGSLGARFLYETNGLRPSSTDNGELIFSSPDTTKPGGPPDHWALFGTNTSPVNMQPLDPNIDIHDIQSAEQFGFGQCMTEFELNDQGQLGGGGKAQRLAKADATTLSNAFATFAANPERWDTTQCANWPKP
jgi:hypothetical protein